jgi:hypothetical protein
MKDEGGRMNESQAGLSFSFIIHPSAFIIALGLFDE